MRKKLALLICLLPGLLMAESSPNNPHVTCEAENTCDSIQQEQPVKEVEQTPQPTIAKIPVIPDDKPGAYDWKKNGLFQALFHVGMNLAQIDGDAYAGYNKLGFDGGGGVLIRFHKYFSASVELNYTQWGAKYSIISNANDSLAQRYRAKLNYIQVPFALNLHDKDIIMFSAGINVGFLVFYNERNEIGTNITDTVQPQPKKFDVDAFAALHVIIKKQFAIGVKFSYSMIPFRGVEDEYKPYTRIQGEYNNVITIRLMYILSAWKKK